MNKQIVVVGASRGIGLETVKALAQNPDNRILALARNTEALSELAVFENVETAFFDLGSAQVKEEASRLFEQFSHIDILINNAGLLINKPFAEMTAEDMFRSYQVNVFGVMQTVQAALEKFNPAGSHVVNISSMGGFQGTVKFPGLSLYSSSKAALVNFTELFSEEYKDSTIKMNCLCLGSVQTEMLEEAFPGLQAPLKASEMAEYIADFSQNAQRFMNGKAIPVSLSTP